MKKRNKLLAALLVMATAISLLSGCDRKIAEKEDAETITVYLWSTNLYDNYDDIVEMYQSGKLAMYFGTSAGVKMFQDQGINTTFLPFFQENGEKWLMTTPYFQVALNRDLTQDEARRKKAMKVLNTMLSEENVYCLRKYGTPRSRYFDESGVPKFLSRYRTSVCCTLGYMVECKQGKDVFASQKKSAIIEILDNQKNI